MSVRAGPSSASRWAWRAAAALAMGLAAVVGGAAAVDAPAAASGVVNPGFELDADRDGVPDAWEFIRGERGSGSLSLGAGHGGRCSARVTCRVMDGGWGPGIGQVGSVAVERGKWYRVSFWAKGDEVASLSVGLHDRADWVHCGLWHTVVLTEQWRRHEAVFRAGKSCSATTRLQFGIKAEGAFWLDDVAFEPSGPPRNEAVLDAAGAKNLVPNASFELGEAGWGTRNADRLFGAVDPTTAAHGTCSFRIVLAPERYPVYHNDFTYRLHGTPSHAAVTSLPLANIGWLPLTKGERYTLSVWLKTDKPGLRVRAAVPQWPGGQPSQVFAATAGWQRHVFSFETAHDSGFVAIAAELEDPTEQTATLWIDGVQLERGGEATAFEPMRPVELAVLSHRPGNVFHVREEAALDIMVSNATRESQTAAWRQTITDFHGQCVQESAMSVVVPAGASVRRRLVAPVSGPGFYRIRLRHRGRGYTQERATRFAVVFPYARRYRGADSQFGINHAFVSDHLMRLARDAGVTWVRSWFLKWDDVERERGRLDFAEADVQVARLRELGFRVEACLATPSSRWSSSSPADLAGTTGAEAELRRNWWLPTSLDDYENYVFRVVDHFKDRIHHWEVFNEPSERKGGPGSNLDLRTNYIRFLRRARAGARRADPKCKLLCAGLHYVSHAIERQGALAEADILSEHAYPRLTSASGWQRRWDAIEARLKAAGGPKPIWLTEYGIYADDDPDPTTAQSRFMVHLGADSEREAATHVVKHYVVALASGVEKAFFHIGNWPWRVNQEHGCGFHMFFEYGGLPRKTYVAHNVLAWMLSPAAKFHKRHRAGPRLFAYEFRTDKKATFVAWRSGPAKLDESARAALCARHTEVRDIAGGDLRATLLEVGRSPVYFRCALKHADGVAAALLSLRGLGE